MSEVVLVGAGLAILGIVVSVVGGLCVWANTVARKHPSGLYRSARWLPRVGALLLAATFLVTVFGLIQSFGAVAHADSASKATMLARGISTSMNDGVAPGVLAMLSFISSALLSCAGTLGAPTPHGRD
jgi:hypothetical protein